jgi:hypothetical protein
LFQRYGNEVKKTSEKKTNGLHYFTNLSLQEESVSTTSATKQSLLEIDP